MSLRARLRNGLLVRSWSNGDVDLRSLFPLLSGDTFRLASDLTWSRDSEHAFGNENQRPEVVFTSRDHLPSLLQCVQAGLLPPTQAQLLIHDGDAPPSSTDLEVLLSSFATVWATNLEVENQSSRKHWLPLGIENTRYGRSGRKVHYPSHEEVQAFARGDINARGIEVLGSFRVSTNPSERQPVLGKIERSRTHWIEPRERSLGKYIDAIRNSRFVISPPGNGLDCHRTWEALYFGAIPVVKKGTIPPNVCESLPILSVEDFDEILQLSSQERSNVAAELNLRPRITALASHWLRMIWGQKIS